MTYSPEFRAKAVDAATKQSMKSVAEEMRIDEKTIRAWVKAAGVKPFAYSNSIFTKEQDDFIRANRSKMHVRDIAKELGFTWRQIGARAAYIGVRVREGDRNRWTRHETEKMLSLMKKNDIKQTAEIMGRSYFSVYAKYRAEGNLGASK